MINACWRALMLSRRWLWLCHSTSNHSHSKLIPFSLVWVNYPYSKWQQRVETHITMKFHICCWGKCRTCVTYIDWLDSGALTANFNYQYDVNIYKNILLQFQWQSCVYISFSFITLVKLKLSLRILFIVIFRVPFHLWLAYCLNLTQSTYSMMHEYSVNYSGWALRNTSYLIGLQLRAKAKIKSCCFIMITFVEMYDYKNSLKETL